MSTPVSNTTICALSTHPGRGAIALIRVSGNDTFGIVQKIFSKDISNAKSHTLIFGEIKDGNTLIDEVLLSIFRNPKSFTGEDSIEISCHGSKFIQQQILSLLIKHGAVMASPGEFTMRAFLNGKMDLSQAEAVADLIASHSFKAHDIAMKQMRGGFSQEIKKLREELINFASLIELELDFSEEDVEFADRKLFTELITRIQQTIKKLIDSFALGNVLKNGVPVAIVGVPNSGKSTLLNALLNEERAIVSEIAGTTRDSIEDEIIIDGIEFRFIDTAGIRETQDKIEKIGIEKTFEKINEAEIILYLFEANDTTARKYVSVIREKIKGSHKKLIPVANKIDLRENAGIKIEDPDLISISALDKKNIDELKKALVKYITEKQSGTDDIIVTNARHHAALLKAQLALNNVERGLHAGTTGDLLAIDIRATLHHLGEITGTISTEDLLGNIFSKFCIGK